MKQFILSICFLPQKELPPLSFPSVVMFIIQLQKIQNLVQLRIMGNNLTTKTRKGNIIKFNSKPFSSGTMRYAIEGRVMEGPDRLSQVVVKVFKAKNLKKSYVQAKAELDVYSLAKFYAKMFNELLKEHPKYNNYKICFPQPDIAQIENLFFGDWILSDIYSEGDYLCVEKYLKGKYVKWTNNNGFRNKDKSQVQIMEILECFQHYTYVKSGLKGICCDLQGVVDGTNIILTDPAVNSIQKKYGQTDLGTNGIKNIIKRHKCNNLCNFLSLSNPKYNPDLEPVKDSTSIRLTVPDFGRII